MGSTYTILLNHFVFSTKNRLALIGPEWQADLHRYVGGILRGEAATAIEIGGMPDHLHILAQLKPSASASQLMMRLKANSSKWVNATYRLSTKFSWQEGYGAFSVSVSQLEVVRAYIRNQAEHHRHRSFQEEFIRLLEHHGIEYDSRYVWA